MLSQGSPNRLSSSAFMDKLNDANRGKDDPHLNKFRLMDNGRPIVNAALTEYPSRLDISRDKQKYRLDKILKDASDKDKTVVDLDDAENNLEYLQKGIKNSSAYENQLSDAGVQKVSVVS